jgi:group I intron endonuclease
VYYGSTANLNGRWNSHRQTLRKGNHSNAFLQRSWNKHGEAAFEFRVMMLCGEEELLTNEQALLDAYAGKTNICYNIAKNALSPMKGRKHSAETRAKMSRSKMGIKYPDRKEMSDETKAKISASLKARNDTGYWLGKKLSDETRERMRIAHIGRIHSQASKDAIQASMPHRRSFTITWPDGKVQSFMSIKSACKELGVNPNSIKRRFNTPAKRGMFKGCTFALVEDK